ncbi:hypothetical protein [Azospirillum lipoferum]|uniref:Uncharacterized protein n=1 Tax=Azospirillum lipoferum (strain 4B) TaxID=862719 RepID=G7ZGK1_AZOL4|nr:hypothetical protein [Azospirillum lipoferum]CBS90937.1 protein of unknown function [Azospirillum lipoferum 4B]
MIMKFNLYQKKNAMLRKNRMSDKGSCNLSQIYEDYRDLKREYGVSLMEDGVLCAPPSAPSLPGGPGKFYFWCGERLAMGEAATPSDPLNYDWSNAKLDVALDIGLRQARTEFFEILARHTPNKEWFDETIDKYREHVILISEFLFVLRALGADQHDYFLELIKLHNLRITNILASSEHEGKSGGRTDALRGGLFPEAVIAKISMALSQGGFELSQSDMARFLVDVMSAETCRKTLDGLSKCGLLEVIVRPYDKARVIRSPGILENCFGLYMTAIRQIMNR